ncbi:MAG: hypothetical protein V7641_1421 [Blastocatellia bacterium]
MLAVPRDYPDYLKHSDHDTPVPTWAQVTRSVAAPNRERIAQVARIVADTDDERAAREVWQSWPGHYQRSTALVIDKLDDEGWLDSIGHLDGWPWDGGFYCWPRATLRGTFAEVLNSLSGANGTFIESRIGNGLFAYLNGYRHKAWQQGWMETDTATAALHVGLMADGRIEIHLDVFNPLFIKGAPAKDLMRIPRLGVFNRRQFFLHRRWEQSRFAALTRTSANLYHLMRASVPLCF